MLDDIAAKEGIQRDNRLYGAFIRKLYDYVTNGEDVTLTGNPLVLANSMGRPLKDCVVSWEPTQEGSGEPYPAGGGVNQLDLSVCTPRDDAYGLKCTIEGDVIHVKGTVTTDLENLQYRLIEVPTTLYEKSGGKFAVFDIKIIAGITPNIISLFNGSIRDNVIVLYMQLGGNKRGEAIDLTFRAMYYFGDTKPAAYAPYANIRPIHGRNGVKVSRFGANLIKPVYQLGYTLEKNGLTFVVNDDYSVTVTGTAIRETYFNFKTLGYDTVSNLFSAMDKPVRNNGFIACDTAVQPYSNEGTRFYLVFAKGAAVNKTYYPQCVYSDILPPYKIGNGETYTLTLPSTIYGGEVDAVTGKGQETWAIGTKSASDWRESADGTEFVCAAPYTNMNNDKAYSNMFDALNLRHNGSYYRISKAKTGFATIDDLRKAIGATPVQIAYKLATPVPFQATGGGTIPTVKGTNTLLTDADTIKATYRCNVRAAEQELDTLYTDLLQELEE